MMTIHERSQDASLATWAVLAALFVVTSTAPASAQVTAEFLGPGDARVATAGPNNLFGNSFVATVSGDVTSIDLLLKRNAGGSPDLRVQIWQIGTDGFPTIEIGRAEFSTTLDDTVYEWKTCPFTDPVPLTAGTTYGFTLGGVTSNDGWDMRRKSGNSYTNGDGFYKFGTGSWDDMAGHFVFGPSDFLFSITVGTSAPTGTDFIRADCNGDGALAISDVITNLVFLFSSGTVGCEKACDVDDDGALGIQDAIFQLNALFVASATPPPSPYPDCGADGTGDSLPCDTFGACAP